MFVMISNKPAGLWGRSGYTASTVRELEEQAARLELKHREDYLIVHEHYVTICLEELNNVLF